MTKITAAGNVEVPAYLVLIDKGYEISCKDGHWIATKNDLSFSSDGPIELLGIVTIYETRGESWKASDNEIESFLAKYSQ